MFRSKGFQTTGWLCLCWGILSLWPAWGWSQEQPPLSLSERLDSIQGLYRQDLATFQRKAAEIEALARAQQRPAEQARAHLFLGIAYSIQSRYDSARWHCDTGLTLANEVQDEGLAASFYRNLGIIAYRLSHLDEARDYYQQAQAIHQKLDDLKGLSKDLTNLGNLHLELGEFGLAARMYEQSIAHKKAIGDSLGLPLPLMNLGNIYQNQHRYVEAYHAYRQGERLMARQDNRFGLITARANLAALFLKANLYEMAEPYVQGTLQEQQEMGLARAFLRTRTLQANLLISRNQRDSAEQILQETAAAQAKLGDSLGLANTYVHWAKMLADEGNLSAVGIKAARARELGESQRYWEPLTRSNYFLGLLAEHDRDHLAQERHAQQVIRWAGPDRDYHYLVKGYEMLAQARLARRDTARAWEAMHAAAARFDTLQKIQSRQAIEAIELQRIIEAEERAQLKLEQSLERAELRSNFFLLGLVALAGVVVVLIISYQNKQRHNQTLNRTNAALREARAEQYRLIGIMTHDLRTPVTQIKALTDQIHQELKPQQSVALRFSENLALPITRLFHTIDRILALNRLEAQKAIPELEPICLQEVLQQVSEQFAPALQQKGLSIEWERRKAAIGSLDHSYTREIFENLLSNAIKFSPAGKRIYVGTLTQEHHVRAYVRDEGPGIDPREKHKLFGKFQKLSARPTGGEPSTGLGLAIIKEYVDRMQGRIWCESKPGEGAIFWVEFAALTLAQ